MKRIALIVVIGLVLGVTALAYAGSQIGLVPNGSAPGDGQIAAVRSNLHAVQMALESYAMDHNGEYPASLLPALRDGGYLAALPSNPYDQGGMAMPEVRAGSDVPGGLTYIPLASSEPGTTGQTGYVLVGYGDERARTYLRRTHQNFERNLPDASHYNVRWKNVVQTLSGGSVVSTGVGAHGGSADISDAPCQ